MTEPTSTIQTIPATDPACYYVAHCDDFDVVHYGYRVVGNSVSTGQANLLSFTDRALWAAWLLAHGVSQDSIDAIQPPPA